MNEEKHLADPIPAGRIRSMKVDELKEYFQYIKRDFAKDEYPPYHVLSYQLKEGIQQGFIYTERGEDLAYTIVAQNKNGYVLISLFAVLPEKRSKGIGTRFLEALLEKQKGKKGVIVEVESLGCLLSETEYDLRRRRIAFYEKAGFRMIPNIYYSIWGIPMHLMVLPMEASLGDINEKIEQTMTDIYDKLLTPRFSHKMVIYRT